MFERVQRDRAYTKIYYDFVKAAEEGAVQIVNKAIAPLNPHDNAEQ